MRVTYFSSPRRKLDAAVKNTCHSVSRSLGLEQTANQSRQHGSNSRKYPLIRCGQEWPKSIKGSHEFQSVNFSQTRESQTKEYSSWCLIQFIMYNTSQGIAYGAANRQARLVGRG